MSKNKKRLLNQCIVLTASEAPVSVSASSSSSTTMTVSWQTPFIPNGRTTGYRVNYTQTVKNMRQMKEFIIFLCFIIEIVFSPLLTFWFYLFVEYIVFVTLHYTLCNIILRATSVTTWHKVAVKSCLQFPGATLRRK